MADDIDIRGGGIVAVDTQSLRDAASRCAAVSSRVRDAADTLAGASRALAAQGPVVAAATNARLIEQSSWMAAARADDLDRVAADLRAAADTYEVIDLRARRAVASGAGDAMSAATALALFAAQHPRAVSGADRAQMLRDLQVGAELVGFANAGVLIVPEVAALVSPLLGVVAAGAVAALPEAAQGAQALIRALGHGTIEPGRKLAGHAPDVVLETTSSRSSVAAPDDLAAALERIPQDDARVRVETYTMPDGTSRYAVYVAGTRDFSLHDDGDDPWDMRSNLQLYFGQDAAAYEAVREAMADAGVPPGAQVYLFGHSQGGMIADWLAVQGGFDVPMLVTAGSPTEAAVGDDTVSIQLRHTDDLVQSLAGGGSDAAVGGPGSMVVERAGDPPPGMQDLHIAPHHLTAYVTTAKALDASRDPRTARMKAELSELRGATAVNAVEYDARRAPFRPRHVFTSRQRK